MSLNGSFPFSFQAYIPAEIIASPINSIIDRVQVLLPFHLFQVAGYTMLL